MHEAKEPEPRQRPPGGKSISRRQFIKYAVAAGGAILAVVYGFPFFRCVMKRGGRNRPLGKTGLEVSPIGLGCAQLGSSRPEYAVRVVEKALEKGVNYFDTARGYWDSEIKLGLALKGEREKVYVSSKTASTTKAEAWRDINQSLERLQTDYLDNCHMHGVDEEEDLAKRLGPGGAIEALIEAKQQGLVRHIGCTGHRSSTLVKALQKFDFETILVPMNIVNREPLSELIPLCLKKGVGVSVMKPVATGLLPAPLALKWLLNQPIAVAVPGATTVEEAEENSLVAHLEDLTLTAEEERQVSEWSKKLEHVSCWLCAKCHPCPNGINIRGTLGSDVMYDHYRTMGPEAFAVFPWSPERVKEDRASRVRLIQRIKTCTNCRRCEERCPYGLPIVKMLKSMVPAMEDMLRIWREQGL